MIATIAVIIWKLVSMLFFDCYHLWLTSFFSDQNDGVGRCYHTIEAKQKRKEKERAIKKK